MSDSREGQEIIEVLRACLLNEAHASWEVFIKLAQPIIAAAVSRTLNRWGSRDRDLTEDLIQDTFVRLCKENSRTLRAFRGNTPAALCAYLRVIAASVTTDRLRSEPAATVPLDDPEGTTTVVDDSVSRTIERHLLLDRVGKCLAAQKERDRRVFWLYHRHGFTPKSISNLPGIGIGTSGVETLLYRLTKIVGECMKKNAMFSTAAEGDLA